MGTKILWSLAWPIILKLLGITRDALNATMNAVILADGMKHEDGTPFTGEEKRAYVLDKVTNYVFGSKPEAKTVVNTLVELALFYLKSVKTL